MAELQPGGVVRVRSRQSVVEEIVAPPVPGDDTRVRLSCLDDDVQGQQLEVLWQSEVDAQVLSAAALSAKQGFDQPLFAAWLHTQHWSCVTSTDPRILQSPSIAVPPYTTPETDYERARLEAFEDEVLDKLFALNAERASLQCAAGPASPPPTGKRPKPKKGKKTQPTLDIEKD